MPAPALRAVYPGPHEDDGAAAGVTTPDLPARHQTAGPLNILLVEDDPGDAMLLKIGLRESMTARYQLDMVGTMAEAEARVAAEPPLDVVLLDLSLPDSMGAASLARLQQAAPNVPVVVMTGLDDPRFADKAVELGAQDYLVKGRDGGPTVVRAIRYAIARMHALIERRTLMERLAAERDRMAAEIAAARAMQFDLLPHPELTEPMLAELGLSVAHYFEPSSGIGGDLWGCAPAGPGRMMFYAFDFAGHGVSAALNVFRLHTLMGHHADCFADPAELLARLNRTMAALLPRGQYATMVACCIDTTGDTLTWAGAGAPAPFLMSEEGGLDVLDTRGLPLGLRENARYANRAVPFGPGANLFLYSDALTEALDGLGRQFGSARLAVHLGLAGSRGGEPLQDLLRRFFDTVQLPVEDDLTAVWITRVR